jgi:ATP-dependent Clp protease ATP-binding subunit ClpA
MNVWERFTEKARRMIFFAQEEAGRAGEDLVSTEHLLLGLVRMNDCRGVMALEEMRISPIRVRNEILKQVAKGNKKSGKEMQLTPRAKRVIDLAHDEMWLLDNTHIGTEHIVLGLIRESEGLGGRVLIELGADLEKARRIVAQIQQENKREEVPAPSGAIKPYRPPKEMRLGLLDKVGFTGTIGAADRPVVEVAVDRDAFTEMIKVFQAKDAVGYQEMVATGKMLLLATGTEAKCLAYGSLHGTCVRLGSGEHAQTIVWVFKQNFSAEQADEEPFPPA